MCSSPSSARFGRVVQHSTTATTPPSPPPNEQYGKKPTADNGGAATASGTRRHACFEIQGQLRNGAGLRLRRLRARSRLPLLGPQETAKIGRLCGKRVPREFDSKANVASPEDDLFTRFAALKSSLPSHNGKEKSSNIASFSDGMVKAMKNRWIFTGDVGVMHPRRVLGLGDQGPAEGCESELCGGRVSSVQPLDGK